jgi:hypothetical protein
VSLFYFEGYDTDDAAAFLGIPPGTLRRRLHENGAVSDTRPPGYRQERNGCVRNAHARSNGSRP